MFYRHKNKLEQEERSKVPPCRKTQCFLFLSLGVMAPELLQYFKSCANAPHKACITTACTMLHPELYIHDITIARLVFEILHLKFKASVLQRN